MTDNPSRYFHGGYPGLRRGDFLLAPDTTRTEYRLSSYATTIDAPEHATRTDVVYLTTSRKVARAYAAFYPDGTLYEVTPLGELNPDPDCNQPGLSWYCRAAEITSIIDPVVLFRSRTMKYWLHLLNPQEQP